MTWMQKKPLETIPPLLPRFLAPSRLMRLGLRLYHQLLTIPLQYQAQFSAQKNLVSPVIERAAGGPWVHSPLDNSYGSVQHGSGGGVGGIHPNHEI